jgi:hypothetical protein
MRDSRRLPISQIRPMDKLGVSSNGHDQAHGEDAKILPDSMT